MESFGRGEGGQRSQRGSGQGSGSGRDGGKRGFRDGGERGFRDGGERGFRDGGERGFRDGGDRGFRDRRDRRFREGGDRGFRDGGDSGFGGERGFGGDRGFRDGGDRGDRGFRDGGDRGFRDGGNLGHADGFRAPQQMYPPRNSSYPDHSAPEFHPHKKPYLSGGAGGRHEGAAGSYQSSPQFPQQQYRQEQSLQKEQHQGIGGGGGSSSFSSPRDPSQKSNSSEAPRGGFDRRGGGGERKFESSCSGSGQTHVPLQNQTSSAAAEEVLHITRQDPPVSSVGSTDNLVPIRRPDLGRNSTRTCNLLVNHFPISFGPDKSIMHYDIDVKAEGERHRRVSKSDLSLLRSKLLSEDSWKSMWLTAYDGEKNIFSMEPLPTGNFKVNLYEEEGTEELSFGFTIKLVNELKFCKLKDYLSGKLPISPRDILQGMDLVMKENCSRRMISVGRSFFPLHFQPRDDLGRGIAAYRGFQHSLKPTSHGLALCLDYSVLAFRKQEPIIDFLFEHIPGFQLNNFRKFRRAVECALKGLKVTVTHRRTKQKYTIAGLTDTDTRSVFFTAVDAEGVAAPCEVNLVDFFLSKYGREIKHKDIPCLNLGKNNKKNYVPMEFCVLVEGQRYPKDDLDPKAANMLKQISVAPPHDRKNFIQNLVQSNDGPCGGGIAQKFGMEVKTHMTAVTGRVIGPPDLNLGAAGGRSSRLKVNQEKCQWNLVGRMLMEGKQLDRWAVVDFTAYEEWRKRLNPDRFIPALIGRCRNLGIRMEEPVYEKAKMAMFSNVDSVREVLECVCRKAEENLRGRLQLIFCVMSEKHPGYKHLKWISEAQIGVVTQCCLSNEANKTRDQTLANLALKINAKLGGSNSELSNLLPHLDGDDHVMLVGADVNHPAAANTTSPSIAAVVATMNWPAANRYAARVCPQTHRKEKILNFGDMCSDLIDSYSRINGVKPKKIVLFRDGVSEGQFEMVLNEEFMDLKRAIQAKNYCPTITLIVAQKRHQTRLFPRGREDGGQTGNVPPGTVVDTDIVHPFEFDFYLCSHYGSIGMSKPTHYHTLWDENGFTSDQLQQLIYNLCFTFARCTKSVSLVPPVYYADLAAYRGRLYHDALIDGWRGAGIQSFGSAYKLHDDIEDAMFFI